jgi:hypothetical protein
MIDPQHPSYEYARGEMASRLTSRVRYPLCQDNDQTGVSLRSCTTSKSELSQATQSNVVEMGVVFSILQNTAKTLLATVSILKALSTEFNEALKRAAQSPGLPNPKPSQTYWLSDPPHPELVDTSSSKLPQTADVVIIGSGIAGAAVARSLLHERRRRNSRTDEKVVVLEARQLCSGATGRNGGHIKPSVYESFARFSKLLPKDRAAALARFQLLHIDYLVQLCQGEGIESAEARKVETTDFYLDSQSFFKAAANVEELKKWVPEVEIAVCNGDEVQKVPRLPDVPK